MNLTFSFTPDGALGSKLAKAKCGPSANYLCYICKALKKCNDKAPITLTLTHPNLNPNLNLNPNPNPRMSSAIVRM